MREGVDLGSLRRVYRKVRKWSSEYGGTQFVEEPARPDEADVVTSELDLIRDEDGQVIAVPHKLHAPVLDIDVPHRLVPSSTHGHAHLYFDVPMSWRQYRRLLRALFKAGLIEGGFYRASVARKYTAVRVPWKFKDGTDLR